MRPAAERAEDMALSEDARREARNEMARPTVASREVPARQDLVAEPGREDGTLGDVGRAFIGVLTRPLFFARGDRREWEQNQSETMRRAQAFLDGSGRRDENARTPEFNFQAVGDINDDVHWSGGPLSSALNALPRSVRTWLDTEGRLARIGVGQFLNANEDDRAVMIANNVPSAEFRRDAHGNLQVRLKADQEWAFLNRPGLSAEDPLTAAEVIERYAPAARLSAAPRLFAARAGVGGVTSAATEYASQLADDLVGGPAGVRASDVRAAGVWGAGGQAAFDTVATLGGAMLRSPVVQRAAGANRSAQQASAQTAAEAYTPASGRDFAAERAAIDERAQFDRSRIEAQTFNERLPSAFDPAQDPTTLNGGQEIRLTDHQRRMAMVEQQRRAAHARIDIDEHGMDLPPPELLHDAASRALRQKQAVFVDLGQGQPKRVQSVSDEGLLLEDGTTIPSAGMVAHETEDGLLFQTPPRPKRPPPAPPPVSEPTSSAPPTPQTASEFYSQADEFGIPITRGEAAQDAAERTREFDMLHGVHGAGAQRRAADFQNVRADAIQRAGMNIATRNQEPLTASIDDAGQVVQNQVQAHWHALTQRINDAYHNAMTALAGVPVSKEAGQTLLSTVEQRMLYAGPITGDPTEFRPRIGVDPEGQRSTLRGRGKQALDMVQHLGDDMIGRAASGRPDNMVRFSHVEQVRQHLLQLQQAAHMANDVDARAIDLIIDGFDEWLGPALSRPTPRIQTQGQAYQYAEDATRRQQAEAAIMEARRLYAERQRIFTAQGSGDLGGRTMARIREIDTTGTQIINQILGAGRIPPSQAMASVQRIRNLAHRIDAKGRLSPDGEPTSMQRRFEGGEALPAMEVQAIREALFMRILAPLQSRGQGNQVPIQSIVTNLDAAVNGPGRAITRELFTDVEFKTVERLLASLRHYVPTSGSRPTGVTAARLLGSSVDAVTRFITGTPGMILRGLVGIVVPSVREAGGEMAAQRAFSRPMFPDGPPRTQSGAAYGQLADAERRQDSGQGAPTPLEQPPSVADRAFTGQGQQPVSATPQTVTVELGGRWYNIPLREGQGVTAAMDEWEAGRLPATGSFGSQDEAVQAALAARAGARP